MNANLYAFCPMHQISLELSDAFRLFVFFLSFLSDSNLKQTLFEQIASV